MLQADVSPESETAFAFDIGWLDKRFTKIDNFAVGTKDVARVFAPRLDDSAPPVELTMAARCEVEWVLQGMEEVATPDTRLEVIHTKRFDPYHE